jgi:hypothetical protein
MNKDMWEVIDVQNILDELAEKVAAPVALWVPVVVAQAQEGAAEAAEEP